MTIWTAHPAQPLLPSFTHQSSWAARIQMDEARTQRQNAVRLTRSQILLAADGVLAHYKEIAQNLWPGGEWYEVLCYRSQHWKIP